MAKGEITLIRDVSLIAGQPTEISHKEVQFTIDGKGAFVHYFLIEDYTPAKALELVRLKTQEWAAVVGRPVEVK